MKTLAKQAVFGDQEDRRAARKEIKEKALKNGIFFASTYPLYQAIIENKLSQMTTPAFNLRCLTFDTAKALFRAAKKEKAGPFIFELAQSEMSYTSQSCREYAAVITAAALDENYRGPLFLQGDHFKLNPKNYSAGKQEQEASSLQTLIANAVEAGFYNIDLDFSALPLKDNAGQMVDFTLFIRTLQPANLIVSLGAEVGEIGGQNTTVEEVVEFLQKYQRLLSSYQDNTVGLSKLAAQTGTAHGRGGKVDFDLARELARKAKEYGLAGIVQHGASTLSEENFKKFPETGVCEIHLATLLQNIIFNHPRFPQKLKDEIYAWLSENLTQEKKPAETDQDFFYSQRKKALGPFKQNFWGLGQRAVDEICQTLEEKFVFFFQALNISGTADIIAQIYVNPLSS